MSVRKKIEQRGTCVDVVTRDVAVREGVMGAGAHKAPDMARSANVCSRVANW